ncbi:hypothetical protein LINPERHAP1_LOCUS10704 [Linum perenne]
MFADDTYIFLRVSSPEIDNLLFLFQNYETYSGQKINLGKSVVTFCNGTPNHSIVEWSEKLGVEISTSLDIYLGLPSRVRKKKMTSFKFLEDLVIKKIHCWKGKSLSPAGMEVLVSSVLSAMPVYTMASFQLPKTTIQKLTQLLANF